MTLRLVVDGQVASVLIDRTDKRNAFNLAMWEAMPALLDEAVEAEGVRILVIRAAQPRGAFCAGADIRELLANKDDEDWRTANQAAINRLQYKLARLPLPTLSFVEGDCIGGGCGIALACDLRLATHAARFGITPAKLGLVYPLHDVKLLTDLVGPGQARRILFTGSLMGAEEALRIGLVEQIVQSPDDMVAELCAASPYTIRETKGFVRRVLDGQAEEDAESLRVFAEAFTGEDFLEGTSAFVEKRKPRF